MITLANIYKRFSLHAGLFARYGEYVYAVNGVNIHINEGDSYGLVGESGSGKTTIAKIIAGIHTFDYGTLTINGQQYRDTFSRPQYIQYIFQDPAKSLNPRQNVLQILTQGYRYHTSTNDKKQLIARAVRYLERVGLGREDLYRRPNEFSGGQRQRLAIARALVHDPKILICDEVVSALDVSIGAQIINLLLTLRKALNITILFIAHDLSLVTYFCDRVGVLCNGVLVEECASTQLLQKCYHPYTERLFRSIPHINTVRKADGIDNTHTPDTTHDAQNNTNEYPLPHDHNITTLPKVNKHPNIQPSSWKDMRPYRMREVNTGHYVVDEAAC